MKKPFLKIFALATVGALCLAGSALATPILTLDDGAGNTVSASDNDGDGVVNIIGTLGSWSVNVTTGLTKPTIGSASFPELDLSSVNVSGGSGTPLTITWFADDFGPVSPTVHNFLTEIGGTTAGTITVQSFYSPTNDIGGLTPLSNLLSFSTSSFSGGELNAWSFNDTTAFAIIATVNHSGPVKSSSFNAELNVPTPSAMLIFGTGLVGLVGTVARRRKVLE